MVFAFSPVVSAMTAILTDPTTTATIYIYFQKIRYICMDAPFPRSNSVDEKWDPFKSATLETKLFSGTYFSTIFGVGWEGGGRRLHMKSAFDHSRKNI